MGCIRPATPGFILTALATALLAVVSFCVPFFKSVFFLKAGITVDDVPGTVTFGTLGYCLELAGNTTCSKPSVGYELGVCYWNPYNAFPDSSRHQWSSGK